MELADRVLMFFVVGMIAIILLIANAAHAHDSWISRGALKNAAGEWCCGAGDCGVMDVGAVHTGVGGYAVSGFVTIIGADNQRIGVNETVPYSEAQPSPDGQYWRCHRPDLSRRCFFAPPPNS